VLVCSNILVSLLRNVIPAKVRIACFIIVIATFVTVVELVMQAFAYPLFLKLGIFIPLIVVNCIVLGRSEAFASKNNVVRSTADGLGIGTGFTLSLGALGAVRELLGAVPSSARTSWGLLRTVHLHGRSPGRIHLPRADALPHEPHREEIGGTMGDYIVLAISCILINNILLGPVSRTMSLHGNLQKDGDRHRHGHGGDIRSGHGRADHLAGQHLYLGQDSVSNTCGPSPSSW
jgi:Na+-translocating ferredoxin:NAD+ oxidoreductase RnfA subunit